MTVNLYEYYAQHIDKVDREQRKILQNSLLSCTPYYFPNPIPVDHGIDAHPEQLNIPSPKTLIQMDIKFPERPEPKTLLYVIDTSTKEVFIFTASSPGNSIAAHLYGFYEKHELGVTLQLYRTNDDPLTPKESDAYTIMLDIALYYINRIGPRCRTEHGLSRQVRRAAERSLGYPLKATTEITINQHPRPKVIHATGEGSKKCWHEVKGHPRVYRRGTPEEFVVWIKPHDRGDPKLGLKKTKYKVEQT